MKWLHPLVAGAGASLTIGLAACANGASTSSGPASAAPSCPGMVGVSLGAANAKVSATDQIQFMPDTQTARVGQVIQWTNTGTVLHTITFDEASCLSDTTIQPQATWEIRFTQPGTYPYVCTIHPGMHGNLTVTS